MNKDSPQQPIPFNRPYLAGKELEYIRQAHEMGMLAGDGAFTRKCNAWLEEQTGCTRALLTHSCTAALEMAAILADIQPGDEIIMPSFTFVSTANAFVLRGGMPVFVDICSETLNMDPSLLEGAVTSRTRAVVPVHYAGVGCEMERILEISHRNGLVVIEDAAQGLMASRRGKALGSFGQVGAISFHETKNVISGEGGALLINDPLLVERAEIVREKGTDRSKFFRGEVDKYTWVDIGSSYLPGELVAAFLFAQMEKANEITKMRLDIWASYQEGFLELERKGLVRRPFIPAECRHNAHMYYLVVNDSETRTGLLQHLRQAGIHAVFHYVPLHSSPAGRRFGVTRSPMIVTDQISAQLLRLPLWPGFEECERVVSEVERFFARR